MSFSWSPCALRRLFSLFSDWRGIGRAYETGSNAMSARKFRGNAQFRFKPSSYRPVLVAHMLALSSAMNTLCWQHVQEQKYRLEVCLCAPLSTPGSVWSCSLSRRLYVSAPHSLSVCFACAPPVLFSTPLFVKLVLLPEQVGRTDP